MEVILASSAEQGRGQGEILFCATCSSSLEHERVTRLLSVWAVVSERIARLIGPKDSWMPAYPQIAVGQMIRAKPGASKGPLFCPE